MSFIQNSCQTIYNLYQAEDLLGEFLCQPLKQYHGYLVHLIESCHTQPQKIAAKATHVATGIFAYPLFGLLSGIGLLIKSTQIPEIQKHNDKLHSRYLSGLEDNLERKRSVNNLPYDTAPGWEYTCQDKNIFTATQEDVTEQKAQVIERLNELNRRFKKVYLKLEAQNGTMTVYLFTNERAEKQSPIQHPQEQLQPHPQVEELDQFLLRSLCFFTKQRLS